MRRSEREILDSKELEEVIKEASVLHIGFNDEDGIYIVPVNFGYADDRFYFHSAKEGKKIDLIKKDPLIGFELDVLKEVELHDLSCSSTAYYRSVIGKGIIQEVIEDKEYAMSKIMEHYGQDKTEFSKEILERTALFMIKVNYMSGKEHLHNG